MAESGTPQMVAGGGESGGFPMEFQSPNSGNSSQRCIGAFGAKGRGASGPKLGPELVVVHQKSPSFSSLVFFILFSIFFILCLVLELPIKKLLQTTPVKAVTNGRKGVKLF